jgi:hypothetical protein
MFCDNFIPPTIKARGSGRNRTEAEGNPRITMGGFIVVLHSAASRFCLSLDENETEHGISSKYPGIHTKPSQGSDVETLLVDARKSYACNFRIHGRTLT